MPEGSLSQEDIDAIINSGALGGGGGGAPASSTTDDPFAGMDSSSGDLADLDSLLSGGGGNSGPSSADIMDALGAGAPAAPAAKPARGGTSIASSTANLNLLMDVTMSLTVELGRTHRYIKDVLQLSEGAVVEMDKNIGEELDLLANGKFIGKGRLVVMDDYYGVQITHIIDPAERMKM